MIIPEFPPSIKIDPYEVYKQGLDAFEKNDFFSLDINIDQYNVTKDYIMDNTNGKNKHHLHALGRIRKKENEEASGRSTMKKKNEISKRIL